MIRSEWYCSQAKHQGTAAHHGVDGLFALQAWTFPPTPHQMNTKGSEEFAEVHIPLANIRTVSEQVGHFTKFHQY